MRIVRVALILALSGVIAVAAHADIITIDGSDTDWTSITLDSTHDDPDDDADPGYNIDESWFKYSVTTEIDYFAITTYDDLAPDDQADNFARILFDTVTGQGGTRSGISGLEYYVEWDMRADPTYGSGMTMYEWNTGASNWDLILSAPADLAIDRETGTGANFAEMSIANSALGSPDSFLFGFHLDDGSDLDDDFSPDTVDQRGYVPEPGTLALVSLGIAGLIGWRRRREDD